MSRQPARKWENVPLVEVEPVLTRLECLAEIAGSLAEVESRRLALLEHRDALVRGARAEGTSWDVIAAACGTTRQALLKRDGS